MSSLSATENGRSQSIKVLRSRSNSAAVRSAAAVADRWPATPAAVIFYFNRASFALHPLDRGLNMNLRRVEDRQARSCRFAQD